MAIFSKQLGKLSSDTQVAIKEIANHIRLMQEDLEYKLLNLDSSNIIEIDTDITNVGGSLINELRQSYSTMNLNTEEGEDSGQNN